MSSVGAAAPCRRRSGARAASSSVAAPYWPKTIGVREARFALPEQRGADAQHHRRLALRDAHVHTAVVWERDERAAHARLDPQRYGPLAGSAVWRRSSVSRPSPLV